MNDQDLTQRMRAASEAVEMTESAQAQHLEAISAALSGGDVVSIAPARSRKRRRLVASVVAAAVIAPAGLAAASESSLPGDTLYPVKQLSERVLVLFDSDVIARHRLEEIEALEESGSVDSELYEQARRALTDLGEDHPLWQRLAASAGADEDRDDSEDRPDAASIDDADDSDGKPMSATLNLPDGSEATFTVVDGQLIGVELPNGWVVTDLDSEEATLAGAGFEVEVDLRDDGTLRAEVTDLSDQPVDDDVSSSSTGSDDDAESEDDTSSGIEPTTPPDDDESEDGSGSGDDDEPADDDPEDDDPEDDDSEEDDTSDDG